MDKIICYALNCFMIVIAEIRLLKVIVFFNIIEIIHPVSFSEP